MVVFVTRRNGFRGDGVFFFFVPSLAGETTVRCLGFHLGFVLFVASLVENSAIGESSGGSNDQVKYNELFVNRS